MIKIRTSIVSFEDFQISRFVLSGSELWNSYCIQLENQRASYPEHLVWWWNEERPITAIYDDGIFQIGKDKFSKTYKFSDINYAVASREDKEAMFLEYSELLNSCLLYTSRCV